LGIWVRNQRREYRKLEQQQHLQQQQHQLPPSDLEPNEQETLLDPSRSKPKSTLTPERLKLLQQLNFEWYKSHTTAWEEQYSRLKQFYELYNHTNVPQNYGCSSGSHTKKNEPPSLGKWCMNQRTAYKNLKRYNNSPMTTTASTSPTVVTYNALTPERIQLLEALQFQWNTKSMKWKQMLQRLRMYYDTHNHSITIPVNDTMNTDLRIWINLQRYYYHNTITANKIEGNSTAGSTIAVLSQQSGTSSSRKTTAIKNRYVANPQQPARTLSSSRIQRLERTIPNFQWTVRGSKSNGPSSEDWFLLFEEMRKKGIGPNVRPKQHWFEGMNVQSIPIKNTPYTEQELLALWNQEDDEDDDET
jgi:hypothetical protein